VVCFTRAVVMPVRWFASETTHNHTQVGKDGLQ